MIAMACKWNGIFNVGEDFDDEDLLKADWDVTTDPVTTAAVPVTGAACRLRDLTSTSVRATEAGCKPLPPHTNSHSPQEKATGLSSAGEKTIYRIKCLSNPAAPSVLSCPPPPPACPKIPAGTAAAAPSSTVTPAQSNRPPVPFPDDFDDWDVDLEDLEHVFRQQDAVQPSVESVSPAKRTCLSERGGGAQPGVSLRPPAHVNRTPCQPVSAADLTPPLPSRVPLPSPPDPGLVPSHPLFLPLPGSRDPRPVRPALRQQTPACGLVGRVSSSPSGPPGPPAVAPSPLRAPVFTNHLVQLVSAASKTPQKRQHQQATPKTRRFPGPAGLLPQQLHGRSLDDIVVSVPQTPTHGAVARLRSQVPSSQASDDEEFSGGPWAAMKAEMGLDERNPACFLHSYSVVMVLRKAALKQLAKNKVPNMAVMVKTLTHTHADAKAVFRDPTGEIRATVHRRLLEDRQGELKPGAVLLLKQVGVFSPSHRNHYLNVTPNNLLRIYSPDRTVWSSTQLSQHSLEGPVPQLEQTSCPPGGTVSNMELLFEDEDECAEGPQNASGTLGVEDPAWETDDLDCLLGELPEDSYTH
ncbi:hypothetical protein COCON_G00203980 [Conger conger]|uniref:Homologous recombination OB-fold protein OB-fold domain-containing protein n=1 Tax=Conger conger TaxID=82655 RepID=A0A9Q1CZF2_CONCO|nr:hypothetical protein COCON_G00203980 [Conger conger]